MELFQLLMVWIDVDRSALAATSVYGIKTDLGMTTADFATAISILFGKLRDFNIDVLVIDMLVVGYIPFQIPSNLIMTKITRPGFCKFRKS